MSNDLSSKLTDSRYNQQSRGMGFVINSDQRGTTAYVTQQHREHHAQGGAVGHDLLHLINPLHPYTAQKQGGTVSQNQTPRSTKKRDYQAELDKRIAYEKRLANQRKERNTELAHLNPKEMAFLKANPGMVQDVTNKYKTLAKKGQGGDTKLGRVSKKTAKALDQLIHHGHKEVNKRTRLREYMEEKKTKYVEEEKNPIAPDNLYSFQKQLNLSHIDKNDQQKRADLVKQRILKRHPKIKSIEENNLSPLALLNELKKIGINRGIAVDTKDYPTTAEMSEFENENLYYKLWKTQNPNEFNQTYMEFMDKNKKPQAFQTKDVDKEFDKWGQSAIKSIQDSKSNKRNRSVYVPSQKGGLYGCGIAATDANEKMLLKKLDQKKNLTPTEEKEFAQRLFDLEDGMNAFSHTDNPALYAAMHRMNQNNQKINEKNKHTKDYKPIPDITLSHDNNLQDLFTGSMLDWSSANIEKGNAKYWEDNIGRMERDLNDSENPKAIQLRHTMHSNPTLHHFQPITRVNPKTTHTSNPQLGDYKGKPAKNVNMKRLASLDMLDPNKNTGSYEKRRHFIDRKPERTIYSGGKPSTSPERVLLRDMEHNIIADLTDGGASLSTLAIPSK